MVDNFRLTVDSNTEIEPLETVRDVRMKGQSLVDNRVATIPQMTGATSSSNGSAGVVPTPSVGDREKFLRGDGTWAEASGGGGSNVSVDQILDDGVNIMDITIDNVTTHIYAPEGGGTVTDVVDGDGTSLVDENGVAHVLGEVTDVVDKNDFSLVNNNVAKIPIEVDSTICSPIPDYANITDMEESKNWINTDTDYTWTAPCDCLLVPVVNLDTDFVKYTIDDFVLYSSWNNDSISTVNGFPIGYELIPLAKDTEISIRFLHRADGRFRVRYRYIPFKRLQTNQESYPQPYLDYGEIRTVSVSDIQSGYTAFADGVFIGAYTNSNSRPVTCYINEETSKYFYMATGNTPGSSMRLGEGDTIRLDSYNISGSGWFIPFVTTDDPTEVYLPVPDYSNAISYTTETIPQSIPRGFLFNDYRRTNTETTVSLSTVLTLRTATVTLNLTTISSVPTYETDRYSCVSWFSMSGTETFDSFTPSIITGETLAGSFISIPYSTQNIMVESHFNVDDVVDGDGNSLVDANKIAHINAKVTDVLYDGVSMMDSDGVVELFPERKVTTLPLLDYENKTAISGSSSWRDTTIHRWTAPCDCVVYIYDQAGTNNTFVRYTIDDFVYYGTAIANNHSVPYGLCSNLLSVKKGQEITIQLLGQMMNNFYNKAFYIPYKLVNENDVDFPLPYLDHDNRVEIGYSVTSYTAPTDGMVVDYGNSVNTIVVTVNGVETTFYGKGGSQYFDCSVPVSAGDVITLGSHSGKYFIPFKRTDNINKLVSPIPDYANRVVYSGDALPTSFDKEGFLFLCAHNYDSYGSSMSADYIINSQSTLSVWAYKYTVSGTDYWKDSFAPVDRAMIKSSASTGNNVNYYFIPYSEFESEFVKDVQVKGTSIVKSGGIANIESMVTDVQNPKGESLVGEGGIATVSGKVFDVQLEGISILDENAVANLKGNMGTFTSPILDYDKIGFIEESKTWTDRTPHDWTAPCDCVIFSCSPNANGGYTFLVDGEFTYKVYKNAWGSYNNNVYASYYTMLPVAKGSVVTLTPTGAKDTSSSYKIAYIPYKKATTLQSAYTLPYLDYENKTAIEWASPIIANELICEYTAPVDGYVSIDLFIGGSNTPTVTYTVNGNNNVNIMTRAMEANYYPNGIILGKGDTISIYDAGNVPTYTYTGNIYFTPFATTPSLREVVSPIPDYTNLETLDLTDFPTTFDTGYIFNCAERQGDNLLKYCKITLSDSVKIYTKSDPYNVTHEYSYFPISGDETLVSVEYETNGGNVYYIPYSEVEVTPVLVSDVQVNGASVVDANGVAHITGGGGGSTVTVTPIQTTGTKIAEIDVDGVTSDLYAPNGGGGGSTVSVTQKVSSGENIASITVDGVATELYATNTTYSDFTGATSQAAGAHGLVPAPTTSDTTKFLKGDGSWGTPDSGSDVSVTQIQSTGTKIATVTIDNVDTDLYAPNGGSGGASDLDDLDDVEITNPTNGQVLKYNSVTQKWENKGSSGTKINIYDKFDSLLISDRFATASLTNGFSFSMSEADDTWSTSATAYTNTAIDLTDYDSLELEITISSQTNYGAFWVTLSTIKYTWSGSQWAQIYFKPSAIKITESGTYTVDVSELSGEYYIYMGGTTGKDTVAAGDCNNTLNGGIAGNVSSVSLIVSGSSEGVVPNPEGEPTDTLNTIEIDGVIYDLPSGSGSASDIVKIYDSGSDTSPAPTNTEITYIDDIDISDYDLIMATYSLDRGSVSYPQTCYATALIDDVLNDSVNTWVVTGYASRWASLRINPTSFIVSATDGDRYGIYKLYAIKLGSGGSGGTSGAELLWEGDFSGTGSIVVPNLSDWLVVAYCNYTGADQLLYLSIGSPSRGGGLYGEWNSGNLQQLGHRFGYNESTNTITVNENDRGIYFNGSTTAASGASNHIYAIYGLVKKEGKGGGGNANIEELTEGEYHNLPGSEKNNGTVYFTYDGGYEYISALDGKIIVRVNTTDPTDCLWFFNGFVATGLDNTVPTELTEYLPSTPSSTAVASKGYGTSEATTQVSWIGFYNGNIRSWSINWTAGYAGTIYGVVDITGGQHQENGYADAYTYPTATPTVPNHIYMNGRKYSEESTVTEVIGTLTSGSTSITLSDASITTDSTFDIYTSVYGVSPTNVTVAAGSITLVFVAQQSNLGVKVRVF